MRSYINNTLVHWTGRDKTDSEAFTIIENIVKTKMLWLSFCPNYTHVPEEIRKKTMMVCFTDLPLHLSKEHCKKFGKFGIGFNKGKMIKYGANPVLYTTKEHLLRMKHFFDLLNKFASLEIDREFNEGLNPYQFTSDQFYSALEISGFMQEYEYSSDKINYYQREWRINYQTLPFEVGKSPEIAGHGGIHGMANSKFHCEMLFDKEDIEYIVTPKLFQKRATELVGIIGCKQKIYEDEINF